MTLIGQITDRLLINNNKINIKIMCFVNSIFTANHKAFFLITKNT